MNVQVMQLPEMRVAAVRHVGPYNEISEAFNRLGAIAGPAGLFQRPDAKMIALFHDNPQTTPAAQLRSDAGIVVPSDGPLPKGLDEQRVPAGTYAKIDHVGPYEGLPAAWGNLMRDGVASSGRNAHPTPASFELYLNTPMDTPKEELRTELYLQLS